MLIDYIFTSDVDDLGDDAVVAGMGGVTGVAYPSQPALQPAAPVTSRWRQVLT